MQFELELTRPEKVIRCRLCGRPLKGLYSRRVGYGRTCLSKLAGIQEELWEK